MVEEIDLLRDRLKSGLIPAVPTPFRKDGTLSVEALERYCAHMSEQPLAGVAVWAHTGRGLRMSENDRERVLRSWRSALKDQVIIAGVGGDAAANSDELFLKSAHKMANHANSYGADALLVFPPSRYRDRPESERKDLVKHYHEKLSSVGLPLVLFYLYDEAGGLAYTDDELRELLALPCILGIKIATLDSVMRYQEISALIREEFPDQMIMTGEDRFLGYSLMIGAEAALIGMGSVFPDQQEELISSYMSADYERFQELSQFADQLSQITFVEPMEGYIGRILYILSKQNVILPGDAFDPWGPALTEADRIAIDGFLADNSPEEEE